MYSPKVLLRLSGLKATCDVRHGRVVLGHADIMCSGKKPFRAQSRKSPDRRSVRVISRARSGRKLKKMTESFSRDRPPSWSPDNRHDEFVGDARLHRSFRPPLTGHQRSCSPFAVNHSGVGLLYALPAVVAVHRVVAAHHRRDLADADLVELGLQLLRQSPCREVGGTSLPSMKQ